MPVTLKNGQVKFPTGVYGNLAVVTDQSANIPAFNVGVVIGDNHFGESYNVNSGVSDPTLKKPVFYGFSQQALVQNKFGKGCELDVAMGYAKKHGLSACYFVGINPTSQGSLTVDDSSAADAITAKTTAYGVIARAFALKITNDTTVDIDITPPKNVAFLKSDAAQSATVYIVSDKAGLKVGDVVYLAANDILPAFGTSTTISGITENKVNGVVKSYNITVSATLNSAGTADVAEKAFLFSKDTANKYSATGLANKAAIINLNNLQTMVEFSDATPANSTLPDTLAEASVAASANGKTTAASSSDWTALLAALPALMKEFENSEKKELRIFCPITGDHATHIAWRDFAVTRRTEGKPIQVIAGTSVAAVNLAGATTSDNPTKQAAAIDSDDFDLCVGGDDGLGGYVTFAPGYFGMTVGGDIAQNMTNNSILFTAPQKVWDESAGEITKLLSFGCIVYDTDPFIGLHIEQGLTTYQDQSAIWNVTEKKTYLRMERTLADYFQFVWRKNSISVGDTEMGVTEADVKARAFSVAQALNGLRVVKTVLGVSVARLSTKNGWSVTANIELNKPNDYEEQNTVIVF